MAYRDGECNFIVVTALAANFLEGDGKQGSYKVMVLTAQQGNNLQCLKIECHIKV